MTKEFTPFEIIAGPCSISEANKHQLYEIAGIEVNGQPAARGARVVGVKSRSVLDPKGKGMGMDFDALFIHPSPENTPPSVDIAEDLVRRTGLIIATEVMVAGRQLPHFEKPIFRGRVLPWNPAVEQLGFPIYETALFCQRNDWDIAFKNPKFLGDISLEEATDEKLDRKTTLESTWAGLASYALLPNERLIFIHRGVDVLGKGENRNALVHPIAKRIHEQFPGSRLYLDPSHSLGPNRRDEIPEEIIKAAHDGYDGAIVETGTSETDSGQHISVAELSGVVREINVFRRLRGPEHSKLIFPSAVIAEGSNVL